MVRFHQVRYSGLSNHKYPNPASTAAAVQSLKN